MIAAALVDLVTSLISSLCSLIGDNVSIPSNLVQSLAGITGYGVWVIGADLLGIICGCVLFWLSVKFIWGLIVYIYDLIPMT